MTPATWEHVIELAGLAALGGYWFGRAYESGCTARGRIADPRIPGAMAVITALAIGCYEAHRLGLARWPLG